MNSCSSAYYGMNLDKTTNNSNLSKGFNKAKRTMIISYNRTDNECDKFYNVQRRGVRDPKVKQMKYLGSGPIRFSQKVSTTNSKVSKSKC